MPAHLILRLDAPLMSFGGDMVDAFGVVRDFPARSMVTGLLANALGWDRVDGAAHQALQDRLVMGAARLEEGERIRDFQTAELGANDQGWTTRGRPEGRAGGAGTYRGRHIRYRDADAGAVVLVALRLDEADRVPTLTDLAAALDRPARPLFIGRKPFVPSGPLHAGLVEADDVRSALVAALPPICAAVRAQWPLGEGQAECGQLVELTGTRNWIGGVHAGLERLMEARLGGLPAPPAQDQAA